MSDVKAHPGFDIRPVRTAADVEVFRLLCQEYGESIRHIAVLTGYEAELAGLPGAYAPPRGEALLARDPFGAPLGCIALRPLDDGTGEIKRLYVRPGLRRSGLGRTLVQAIVEAARRIGYPEVKLDTLPQMTEAQALYRSLGFTEIGRYNDNPNRVLVFMSKRL